MRIPSVSPVRFQAQPSVLAATLKVDVAHALKTNQVQHVKSLQAFDLRTIVVWVQADKYGDVMDQMNTLGRVFTPAKPPGTCNEYTVVTASGTPVLIAITPEGSPAPYSDYGMPVDKTADAYTP